MGDRICESLEKKTDGVTDGASEGAIRWRGDMRRMGWTRRRVNSRLWGWRNKEGADFTGKVVHI